MYKRKQYKKLQTKNESFLNVTSLRNRDSPEAGVSCLIRSGAQHLLFFSLELKLLDCSERVTRRVLCEPCGVWALGLKGRGLTARCGRVQSAGLDIRGSRLHDVRA